MRIIILGSGVIGVTSAWFLAEAGHEVVVVDRRRGPAEETSFANAGEVSPGYASPWAAPGIPLKALRWLTMRHAPLIVRPRPDRAMLRWVAAILANCTPRAYAINKERMVRLAEFSRVQLAQVRTETGIRYDEGMKGTLQLFRTEAQLASVGKDIAVLQADGIAFELLDQAGCIDAEPGLANSDIAIAGGLRLPGDETGDCYKFTCRLAELAAARGVRFEFERHIERIEVEGDRVAAVRTDHGQLRGDAYVVALGSHAPRFLSPAGIRLPVYPVKGYSITVPVIDEARAPVSTLLDESYKIAITRLGTRIRVGGMAELAGFDPGLGERRLRTLEHSVQALFPGAADYRDPGFWCGFRPMTPDGTPVIGRTHLRNMYLNTGHGTLGWTMACGSAHVLRDIIGGRATAIASDDLSLDRYN